MLTMVHAVHDRGVPCAQIADVLPASKFRAVPLVTDTDDLWAAMVQHLGLKVDQSRRWHLDEPIHEAGLTWVLHSNWGIRTNEFLDSLSELSSGAVRAKAEGKAHV
jgi:hypothetical protein